MWIRIRSDSHLSGSRGIKCREKQSLTNKVLEVFCRIIFFKSELKKSSQSLRFFFSQPLKIVSNKFGDFTDLDLDPDPHAIDADPHHWSSLWISFLWLQINLSNLCKAFEFYNIIISEELVIRIR